MLITQTPANLNCSEFELLGFDSINFAVPVTTSGNKKKNNKLKTARSTNKSITFFNIFGFFSKL